MSELRAPDPTLTDYGRREGHGIDIAVRDPYEDAAIAHRIVGRTLLGCGNSWENWFTHPVFAARWFCRPCRTCFRGAPIAGVRRSAEGTESGDPHLSWQVPS